MLPKTQFAYQKGLSTCDALLCVSHARQSALESGQEARIVQIDFSAAFDRVNHDHNHDFQLPNCINVDPNDLLICNDLQLLVI